MSPKCMDEISSGNDNGSGSGVGFFKMPVNVKKKSERHKKDSRQHHNRKDDSSTYSSQFSAVLVKPQDVVLARDREIMKQRTTNGIDFLDTPSASSALIEATNTEISEQEKTHHSGADDNKLRVFWKIVDRNVQRITSPDHRSGRKLSEISDAAGTANKSRDFSRSARTLADAKVARVESGRTPAKRITNLIDRVCSKVNRDTVDSVDSPVYRKNHYLMSIDGGTGDKTADVSADFFDKYYNEGIVYGDYYIGSLLPTLNQSA